MAKIPTGRIVLYVVLAIIVIVVGIWVIRTRAQEARLGKSVMKPDDVAPFINRVSDDIDKIEKKASALSGPEIDQAIQLLNEARTGLQELQSLSEPSELTKKRDEIRDKIAEARKLIRKAKKGGE